MSAKSKSLKYIQKRMINILQNLTNAAASQEEINMKINENSLNENT